MEARARHHRSDDPAMEARPRHQTMDARPRHSSGGRGAAHPPRHFSGDRTSPVMQHRFLHRSTDESSQSMDARPRHRWGDQTSLAMEAYPPGWSVQQSVLPKDLPPNCNIDHDDEEEEEEEDDDEDEDNDAEIDDSDEEKNSLVAEKAYQKLLPEVKLLIEELCGSEKPNLVTDRGEKCCAVCPTIQRFKGWKALLAHAGQFKKKRVQQHRGYHRALMEAMRVDEKPPEDESTAQGRAVAINPEVHLIVWPPVVIIQTTSGGSNLFHRSKAFLSEEFPGLHVTNCLPVSRTCSFVEFKPEAVGYLEAQRVAKWFADRRRGRQEIEWRSDRRIHEERQPLLYGYLATPEDMRFWDPQREVIKDWTKESYHEKVQGAQRKFKQEHDKEQAMLKAMELQVENLAEDELKFKTNKENMERLIGMKQKEIETHKRRAEEMERLYLDAVNMLYESFQKDIKIFEARSASKVKRLREELEQFEKRFEEERAIRTKDIENLQQQFQVLTENHKEKETQKAAERELELMQKKEDWMKDMAKTEAIFNRTVRERESSLQEKQHQEMMLLLEEAKKERERMLNEYLEKQEALEKERVETKKAKEEPEEPAAKEEIVQVSECAVCFDPFTEVDRALLKPCGHTGLCLKCAKDVYKEKGTCPFCRKKIQKPIFIPKKLYM